MATMPAGTGMYNTFRMKKHKTLTSIIVYIPLTSSPFSNFPGLIHIEQLSGSTMMPKEAQFTEIQNRLM